MSPVFRREGDGAVGRLAPPEMDLLRDLAEQLRELYRAPMGSDAALERLFPDGHRDDPEAAAELRALTEDDLREVKAAAVEQVLANLDGASSPLHLSAEESELWLRALTDVRLTLAVRLGISTPEDADEIDPDDPDAYPWLVYEWLGSVQDSLVNAVAGW